MCVSPFQKWHKQRKAHDDPNVTSDTAIVVGTSFICLCRTDKSVFSFSRLLLAAEMPPDAGHGKRESAPATISGCHVFPVLKPSCHAFAKPGMAANDRMKEMIQENYNRIKAEVRQIVADELQRIQSDPELQHLLQGK